MIIHTFDEKHSIESETFTFDFSNLLADSEIIQEADVTITVKSGTDPTPNSMISGSARINGAKVSQLLTGGIAGNYYYAKFTVITSVQTLVAVGVVPITAGV